MRVLSAERWARCSESWGKWKDGQGREVGSAVKVVVEELEADHLRPTGILGRLKQGIDPGIPAAGQRPTLHECSSCLTVSNASTQHVMVFAR